MPRALTREQADRLGGPQAVNWHVVRVMSEDNVRRIKHAKVGRHWSKIPKRLRPDCHQDRDVGFQNVYGRMRWNREAPTITGGCTTFSKGRFGHPRADRTISVFEAALLQTFPADYVFDTPYMEYVCNIIGNALPCEFAEVIARHCVERLRARQQT
jgi:DNA (cytosine-5)-methyltransferase 1